MLACRADAVPGTGAPLEVHGRSRKHSKDASQKFASSLHASRSIVKPRKSVLASYQMALMLVLRGHALVLMSFGATPCRR